MVGLLLLAFALGGTLDAALTGYSARAAGTASLPAEDWARWTSSWLDEPFLLGTVLFLPLVFPNGQLQSPRWRIVSVVGVGLIAIIAIITTNDAFGLGWIDWAGAGAAWFARQAATLFALPLGAAIISLALRLRHSRGEATPAPADTRHRIAYVRRTSRPLQPWRRYRRAG